MANHEVATVRYMGWGGLKNGALIAEAEANGMEVFVTGDRNLSYQQNLIDRKIAIVTLSAHNWPIIRNYTSEIATAVDLAVPGSFQFVECAVFASNNRQRDAHDLDSHERVSQTG